MINLCEPLEHGARFSLDRIWTALKAADYQDRDFLLSREDFDDLPPLLSQWTDWAFIDRPVASYETQPAIAFHGIVCILEPESQAQKRIEASIDDGVNAGGDTAPPAHHNV